LLGKVLSKSQNRPTKARQYGLKSCGLISGKLPASEQDMQTPQASETWEKTDM
jgi:hypothetical protein